MDHDKLAELFYVDDLLNILKLGLKQEVFSQCPAFIRDMVRLCVTGSQEARLFKVEGYEVNTYLLPFLGSVNWPGLVLKIVPLHLECLIRSTTQESSILREMKIKSDLYSLPRHVVEFDYKEYRIFISQLLPGTLATKVTLGKSEIGKIVAVIREIQTRLCSTTVGIRKLEKSKSLYPVQYYVPKIKGFLITHFNMNVERDHVGVLDSLDGIKNSEPIIVSDRSPANFLIDKNGRIGVFDFGLVLAGTRYEDWSWFIDDPRLDSVLTRRDVLKIFCDYERTVNDARTDHVMAFHLSAIFVCIKQYCVMKRIYRNDMANHYLRRAAESAKEISAKGISGLIKKLKTSKRRAS